MNNRTVEGKVILKDTSLLQAAFTYKSSEESYPLSTWYGGDSVEVDEFGNVYSVYPEPVKIQFSDVEIESFLVRIATVLNPKTNQYERKLDQICLIFKNEEGFLQDFSDFGLIGKKFHFYYRNKKVKQNGCIKLKNYALKE